MKRILVTGATGFIGSRLVTELRSRGVAVTAAVRNETRLPEPIRTVRIDDVGPATSWSEALEGCDCVIHLAARVHMMRDASVDPLLEYRRVNVGGTVNLAKQAEAAGVGRFVFISSIKVNGDTSPSGRGFRETDSPAPNDPYGISKAEAEQALAALAAESGLEFVIIRPPLVYGPGVKANFLSMTRWLQRGVPLPLGSFVANRRSLVAVDNLIDLIITCAEHPAAANEIFLAGDGEDLSTTELLRRTAAALGVRPRLLPVPVAVLATAARVLRKTNVMQRLGGTLQVDISKARTRLGWSPPISVDEGLRRAVSSTVASAAR
jgi:nucleoside-diphosphate-sugar epimerase